MMIDTTYHKIASKIVALFADGRLTYEDWNYIALNVVTQGRQDYLLNRIEHFANGVVEYRNQIKFGDNGYEQDSLF